jgi:hypothetical protein
MDDNFSLTSDANWTLSHEPFADVKATCLLGELENDHLNAIQNVTAIMADGVSRGCRRKTGVLTIQDTGNGKLKLYHSRSEVMTRIFNSHNLNPVHWRTTTSVPSTYYPSRIHDQHVAELQ